MKKVYLFCLLAGALAACGGKKTTNEASLHGEIKGLGNDTLYLYGADWLYDRMDTLVAKDSKFTATLPTDTLVATWLLLRDGVECPLFLNKGDRIEIKGSLAEPEALEISGNTANEELTLFRQGLKGMGQPSAQALEEKAESFITGHPFSLASIYLLEKYFAQKPQPDFRRIKRLVDGLAGELKDRPYITELQNRIQESEKADLHKTVPFFRLNNAEGKAVSRGDFKDQYLLVHFWASWDTLSREQNAVYRRIYRAEQAKEKKRKRKKDEKPPFALLGISLDVEPGRWREAIRQDSLEWEQAFDFGGWNAEIVQQLALTKLPANVLLNPNGRIEAKDIDEAEIEQKIAELEQQEKEKQEEERRRKQRK